MFEFLQGLLSKRPAPPKASGEALHGVVAGHQRAEGAARESDERFRLLVESVRDYAIFMLDPGGHVVTWNAGAERIKGYKAHEIIGQHFSKFYPAEVAARGWPDEELRRAAKLGRFEDEGWRIRKDGTQFWANVVITALRDSTGELRGFAKVTRDLTERREAEERARRLIQEQAARQAAEVSAHEARRAQEEERRQRDQFQVTLSSIGDGVIVTDNHGIVTFMNPVAETLTGWRAQEAAGKPLEKIFTIVNEQTPAGRRKPGHKGPPSGHGGRAGEPHHPGSPRRARDSH
jgi:PAS domain S-box-containing protein